MKWNLQISCFGIYCFSISIRPCAYHIQIFLNRPFSFFCCCCGFKKYSVFTGYQIFVTGKILVFHRCLDNKLLLSYYILLHWKLKRSAEFSPKVPIQPSRPKSDSASPLAISAQFKPKQPQRIFQPTLGPISAIRSNSTLGNWTVLPLI